MKDFYFFRTKKLVKILSARDVSRMTSLAYFIYLLTLIAAYLWLPNLISPEISGSVSGKHHLTLSLQLFIIFSSLFIIFKVSKGFSFFRVMRGYVAVYSTEFLTFFLVRILLGFSVLYICALMGISTESGFERSHYPTLVSEMISTCGAELLIQLHMIYRFFQIHYNEVK